MEEEIDLDRTLAERVWQLRPLVDRYVADHGLGEAVDAEGLATSLARACPEGRTFTDAVRRCLHLLAVGIVASGLADREAERLGCDPATFRRMRRALSRPPRDGEGWGDPQVPPREAVAWLAARAGRYEHLPEGDPYRDRHRELERLAGEGRPLLFRVAARLVPADADDVVQDALDHCMQRLLRDFLLERPPLLREVGDGDLRARMEAYVTVAVRRRAFDVLRRGRAQVAPLRPAAPVADPVDEHAPRDLDAADARVRLHELRDDLPRLREALLRRLTREGRHRRLVLRALEAAAVEGPEAMGANPDTDPVIAVAWYAARRLGEVDNDRIGPDHTRGSAAYKAVQRAADELRGFLRDEAGGA